MGLSKNSSVITSGLDYELSSANAKADQAAIDSNRDVAIEAIDAFKAILANPDASDEQKQMAMDRISDIYATHGHLVEGSSSTRHFLEFIGLTALSGYGLEKARTHLGPHIKAAFAALPFKR